MEMGPQDNLAWGARHDQTQAFPKTQTKARIICRQALRQPGNQESRQNAERNKTMSAENMLIALINALITVQRKPNDDITAVMRDVVGHDNVQPMHNLVSPELPGAKVTVAGASKLDDWRPPAQAAFDALMDEDDRRFRAQRKRELGQG